MKRTPLRRRASLRARPNEPLAVWCQAAIPDVCMGRAVHRHHILPRSAGGTHDAFNTTDLCGACHRHVHANPAWAYETGLLQRRDGAALGQSRPNHRRPSLEEAIEVVREAGYPIPDPWPEDDE